MRKGVAEDEKNVGRKKKKRRGGKGDGYLEGLVKATTKAAADTTVPVNASMDFAETRHAIAIAAATAAAAEAAVATAQEAVEIVRLSSRPSNYANVRELYAAVARRALRALKGLVKLRALVREHNVRRQTKLALKCMQSLVRVQDRVLDQQRARLSHEGYRKSMFGETNALWESRYLQDIRRRNTYVVGFMAQSRDMSCPTDEWDDMPQTSEEIEASLQNRREAALKPSPRRLKEEKSYSSAANTPSLASTYCTTNGISRYVNTVPNYMAATESAKAKVRSQSTPRQRPSTPGRERGGSLAKKILSYPALENHVGSSFSQNLRSPSFKSAFEGHYWMKKESLYSSYTESFGGQIFPCSTTDIRWLKRDMIIDVHLHSRHIVYLI
ncbi:putative electron transporter [Hibiscus syriacus]|uniref:Electron transporter n=1 Tax=Hibiscus syriacus TaxID=106335 RepID=A0A6A3CF37_HIBSY|nr:putative electron transporter [Hibiscus syriacus]